MIPVRIVSAPDPDCSDLWHDHLWVLAGGGDYCEGAIAAFLGEDRDTEGEDLAGRHLSDTAESLRERGVDVELDELRLALSDYRAARLKQQKR